MGLFQGRFARVAVRSVAAAAVSLAVLGAVTSAQASVVFDFAGLASGNEGPFTSATAGGITVTGTASNTDGTKTPVAYLDDVFNSNPAGLGVCSEGLTGGECSIPSDDNVTSGETLTLSFTDAVTTNPITVTLDPIFFRDANHLTIFDESGVGNGLIDIVIDGGSVMVLTLAAQLGTPLTGSTFDFTYNNQQFYIQNMTVTPVPLPAALPLFLSALAGLAFIGRRRRKKAAA